MIVGIDLGTTNSALGTIIEGAPTLIPNALGQILTPSVVGIDMEDNVVVGATAKELQVVAPERCASAFKRAMGTDRVYELAGHSFTPIELSGLVLNSLKKDAELQFGESVEQAVITVPAYFNEHQRRATIRAGELAGLSIARIVNEPTAAALAYGLHDSQSERVAVVFDLGGGTFDISIIDQFEGVVEVRASSGECFLGGEDFTSTFVARLLEKHGHVFEQAELTAPRLVARMTQLCEIAKRDLARKVVVDVPFPETDGTLSPVPTTERVTREVYEDWTKHIVRRMDIPIRRALGDARLDRRDVDAIVLVGGATRMPAVREYVRNYFKQDPECRLNPDEVVAMGATVQAGLIARDAALEDLVVTDVAPFTLGIGIAKRFGTEHRAGYFSPIIERNTTIPVSRVHNVGTIHANQTEVQVEIYQGECRMVKDNLQLGEFRVVGIPSGPPRESVSIRFTYDMNGVLEAEATVLETGQMFSHVITQLAGELSPEEIEKTLQRMQALKTHPRDEEQNRYLLKRAQRVYQQLELTARDELDKLLDAFESALESQDKSRIELASDYLLRFLDTKDPETPEEWSCDD
ncbi:Chaperone protein HscC [Symmachiella macrocystis]|uniref:Chaperone protein HscC n=1 Tax=Symmachiella macrocystis TaxID=2527985 RepID=A0A5C6B188_9PLAN|nr:Hsp70 family protein [Symmachiella macrocystis]TWU05172.1 Chaperone protein HscC [Symmachiella macrocystis]